MQELSAILLASSQVRDEAMPVLYGIDTCVCKDLKEFCSTAKSLAPAPLQLIEQLELVYKMSAMEELTTKETVMAFNQFLEIKELKTLIARASDQEIFSMPYT